VDRAGRRQPAFESRLRFTQAVGSEKDGAEVVVHDRQDRRLSGRGEERPGFFEEPHRPKAPSDALDPAEVQQRESRALRIPRASGPIAQGSQAPVGRVHVVPVVALCQSISEGERPVFRAERLTCPAKRLLAGLVLATHLLQDRLGHEDAAANERLRVGAQPLLGPAGPLQRLVEPTPHAHGRSQVRCGDGGLERVTLHLGELPRLPRQLLAARKVPPMKGSPRCLVRISRTALDFG
jgi:hypothetical protein